jgi:hypothetical protein
MNAEQWETCTDDLAMLVSALDSAKDRQKVQRLCAAEASYRKVALLSFFLSRIRSTIG